MKISYGSIVGLLIAIIALGLALRSYETSYFLNLEAALIVFGGTLAATMIAFEGKEVFRALGAMRELIVPSPIDDKSMMSEVQTVVDWGRINAREGKLGLEKAFEESDMTRDRFLQYSIDLFGAGYPVESLRTKMETFVSNQYEQGKKSVEILKTMGAFSPAFGMIGTLIGLVGMLSQLDDFAGKIGEPMAVALITTFYGAVAQQLLFKPAAQRTDAKNRILLTRNLMMTEAFLLLVSNKGSMEIQDHLNSFILQNTPMKSVSNEAEAREGN